MSAEIYKKLAAALDHVASVQRSESVNTGKYEFSFATLASTIDAVEVGLADQKLSYVIVWRNTGDYMTAVVRVIDDDTGDTVDLDGPTFKIMNDPQAVGSATTYGRRYALTTVFNIKVEDDDGGLAHRAATTPDRRTPAEQQIREHITALPDAMAREDFQVAFIEEFGCGLSQLPESRHGDALTWTKARITPPPKKKAAAKKAAAERGTSGE